MYCRHCGTENLGSAAICAACGNTLSVSAQHIHFNKKNYARYRQRGAPHAKVHAKYGFNIPAGMPLRNFGVPGTVIPQPAPPRAPLHKRPRPAQATPPLSETPTGNARRPQSAAPLSPPTGEPLLVNPLLDEEDYAKRFPPYQRRKPLFASAWTRAALIVGCIMLAIGAGIGAWWISDNGGVNGVLANLVSPPRPVADHRRVRSSGISAGELPYDGLPPDVASESRSSGESVAGNAEKASTEEETPDAMDAHGTIDQQSPAKTMTAPSAPANADKPKVQGVATAQPIKKKNKPTQKPATSQQKTSQQIIARDKEIGRIQHQADDELKKKIEFRRTAAMTRTRTALAARHSGERMRMQLARCGKLDGLIQRELCKWRLCNGRWGRNGCPSYIAKTALS